MILFSAERQNKAVNPDTSITFHTSSKTRCKSKTGALKGKKKNPSQ